MEEIEISSPPFKIVAQMIHLMMPCTTNFTKETLFGRLEATEFDLKQLEELDKVETTFSALIFRPSLVRNTSAQGDFANSSKTIEEKVKGVALLVEREKDGKNIFKVGHVMNMVIMHLSVLKEKGSIREDSDLEDLETYYMQKKKKKNLIKKKVKMNWDS